MFLKLGQRGLLLGRTGSGKSQNAIFQLKNPCVFPVFILDTKIEDCFFSVPSGSQKLVETHGLKQFSNLLKTKRDKFPEYVLVRPSMAEMMSMETLDYYMHLIYQRGGECFTYVDELYNWHSNGRAQAGLIGMLTRGRSKGKTVLMASQRPSFLTSFAYSESDKFYLYRLNDRKDNKRVGEFVPDFELTSTPPDFHFYHYDFREHDSPVLYRPVPETKIDEKKFNPVDWI